MKISIFGLGYVGCVTAACLAKDGHEVIGVDVVSSKVDKLASGRSTVVETGLDELIAEGHRQKRITATTNGRQAVLDSEASIVCVGTPTGPDGSMDLTALRATILAFALLGLAACQLVGGLEAKELIKESLDGAADASADVSALDSYAPPPEPADCHDVDPKYASARFAIPGDGPDGTSFTVELTAERDMQYHALADPIITRHVTLTVEGTTGIGDTCISEAAVLGRTG